jgi:Ran GTPase-activating protein (RanGAP) involved in mRNA processing and transport
MWTTSSYKATNNRDNRCMDYIPGSATYGVVEAEAEVVEVEEVEVVEAEAAEAEAEAEAEEVEEVEVVEAEAAEAEEVEVVAPAMTPPVRPSRSLKRILV